MIKLRNRFKGDVIFAFGEDPKNNTGWNKNYYGNCVKKKTVLVKMSERNLEINTENAVKDHDIDKQITADVKNEILKHFRTELNLKSCGCA